MDYDARRDFHPKFEEALSFARFLQICFGEVPVGARTRLKRTDYSKVISQNPFSANLVHSLFSWIQE
jgi:hypothetical protein